MRRAAAYWRRELRDAIGVDCRRAGCRAGASCGSIIPESFVMRPCGDGPCERARTARRAADGRESGEAASRAAYRAAGEGNRARLRRDVVGSASENGARARRSRLCPRARLAVARSARRRACFDCARDARALNAHANDGAVGDHRSEAGTPVAPPSAIRFVADLANRRESTRSGLRATLASRCGEPRDTTDRCAAGGAIICRRVERMDTMRTASAQSLRKRRLRLERRVWTAG